MGAAALPPAVRPARLDRPAVGRHITFCISYVAVVVRARADVHAEEAARDLGASAWGAFRYVTLPLIAPAVLAGLLAFSLTSTAYIVRRSTRA